MSKKLEIMDDASSSKKAKLSPPPQFRPEVAVKEKATVNFDQDILRCPVCCQFPRKQIRQCDIGHSVCSNCVVKLSMCPTCQRSYNNQVRNYTVEGLMDSMKFQCSWNEFGCKVAPMARKHLTSHEAQCEFNPNSVSFCLIIAKFCCSNKFCPVSTQDPTEMNVFLNHMKYAHVDFNVRDVNLGVPFILHFKYNWTTEEGRNAGMLSRRQPALSRTILRLNSTDTNLGQGCQQLYVILCRFQLINGQDSFLTKCVRLTDETRDTMTISLSLTGREKVGPSQPQVPELSWTVQPQGIRQAKEYLEGTEDDLSFYHMIPIVFLKNYISADGIPLKLVFN